MHVAVCMEGLPAFVMQGKPNGEYLITTKPTYYIAVTDKKVGTVVSGEFLSHSQVFEFPDGATEISGTLNEYLKFNFNL